MECRGPCARASGSGRSGRRTGRGRPLWSVPFPCRGPLRSQLEVRSVLGSRSVLSDLCAGSRPVVGSGGIPERDRRGLARVPPEIGPRSSGGPCPPAVSRSLGGRHQGSDRGGGSDGAGCRRPLRPPGGARRAVPDLHGRHRRVLPDGPDGHRGPAPGYGFHWRGATRRWRARIPDESHRCCPQGVHRARNLRPQHPWLPPPGAGGARTRQMHMPRGTMVSWPQHPSARALHRPSTPSDGLSTGGSGRHPGHNP